MAEEKNQKIKLMKIMEILSQETDEEHPMTKVELSARLVAMNVSCSPRSLIRDIKLLNEQHDPVFVEEHCLKGHTDFQLSASIYWRWQEQHGQAC